MTIKKKNVSSKCYAILSLNIIIKKNTMDPSLHSEYKNYIIFYNHYLEPSNTIQTPDNQVNII